MSMFHRFDPNFSSRKLSSLETTGLLGSCGSSEISSFSFFFHFLFPLVVVFRSKVSFFFQLKNVNSIRGFPEI